jgi:hypothetical protein
LPATAPVLPLFGGRLHVSVKVSCIRTKPKKQKVQKQDTPNQKN